MFIPIGDTPNPRNFTPYVNWGLIAANILVFFLLTPSTQSEGYVAFIHAHGFTPGHPEWTDLFSSMFLHGGFMHLFGNMLFLWIYGDNVEHRLGRAGYLLMYLFTGVVATLSFSAIAAGSTVPLVGASGAISGVMGIYFLLFPRNRIKVFIALFPFFFHSVYIQARWVLGFYVVVSNLLPMFLVGTAAGVAYGAHLGGFIGGLGIALIGERLAWRWPWSDAYARTRRPKLSRVPDPPRPADVSEIRAAMASHDMARAVSAYGDTGVNAAQHLTAEEAATLGQWLQATGHPVAATQLLRRAMRRFRHSSEKEQAHLTLALGLTRLEQGQPTAAYHHFLATLELDADAATQERARMALANIDPTPTLH